LIASWILLCAAVFAVAVQILIPGQPLYHYGWYNVAIVVLVILAALRSGRSSTAARVAFTGSAIVAVAGAASGLLGPDTQIVVGAPGTNVQTNAGRIDFPLKADEVRRRYSGASILWPVPRMVVYVGAADARRNGLTVTQPTGAAFLSPVLLMQREARIAGMQVRIDSFAVPALRRSVKAVLFTPQQVARLRIHGQRGDSAAVLFAVSDAADRVVPNGIGIVASGAAGTIDGIRLHASVQSYPAIAVASAPYLPLFAAGIALLAGGGVAALKTRWNSKT